MKFTTEQNIKVVQFNISNYQAKIEENTAELKKWQERLDNLRLVAFSELCEQITEMAANVEYKQDDRYCAYFDNGQGISVIGNGYGKESGLFEIAVMAGNEEIDYTTPIADDVIGWLTLDEVYDYAKQIAALPQFNETEWQFKNAKRYEY